MFFLKDHGFVHRIASDITPREVYEGRRTLLKSMAAGGAGMAMASWASRDAMAQTARPGKLAALSGKRSTVPAGMTLEKLTSYGDVSSYNNFYEFGTDKSDPARNAGSLKTRLIMKSPEAICEKPVIKSLWRSAPPRGTETLSPSEMIVRDAFSNFSNFASVSGLCSVIAR